MAGSNIEISDLGMFRRGGGGGGSFGSKWSARSGISVGSSVSYSAGASPPPPPPPPQPPIPHATPAEHPGGDAFWDKFGKEHRTSTPGLDFFGLQLMKADTGPPPPQPPQPPLPPKQPNPDVIPIHGDSAAAVQEVMSDWVPLADDNYWY